MVASELTIFLEAGFELSKAILLRDQAIKLSTLTKYSYIQAAEKIIECVNSFEAGITLRDQSLSERN